MFKSIKNLLRKRNICKEITNRYELDTFYPDGSCNRCKHYKPIAPQFALTTFQIATYDEAIAHEIQAKYAEYIVEYIEPVLRQHGHWSPINIILSLRKVEKQEQRNYKSKLPRPQH